jgi:hypothetical protein
LNENYFSPRILYPAKLALKIDREMKIFHDKQEVICDHKLPLQKIMQGIVCTEDESKQSHEKTGCIKPQEKKKQAIREWH